LKGCARPCLVWPCKCHLATFSDRRENKRWIDERTGLELSDTHRTEYKREKWAEIDKDTFSGAPTIIMEYKTRRR